MISKSFRQPHNQFKFQSQRLEDDTFDIAQET